MPPDDGDRRIDEIATPRGVAVRAFEIGLDREYSSIEKAESLAEDIDSTNPNAALRTSIVSETIEPPYDPDKLCRLHEHSNSLRQNIDAYATNIDGFGHTFDPVIQLKEAGARDLIRDAIYFERYEAARAGGPGSLAVAPAVPTDAEVEARIAELQGAMRMEKARIESFFAHCVAEESFTSLRRRTRQDIEVTGNGYWEVIRNDLGEVSQFSLMPARSIRVTGKKARSVDVMREVRFGAITFRREVFKRRFRRFAQTGGDKPVWFKEFGDPAFVSATTGQSYETKELFDAAEGASGAQLANEVFHFKVHALSTSAYGVPRWIGNLLSVLGSRAAEEVNLAYFDNKGIPPLAILVSGGRLGEESVSRIQEFVELQIKGRKNFHKILVIEAETTAGAIGLGSENAGTMRVEIKQLTDAQLKDGLFLEYDSSNMDKVGMGFRLPRLLRGDIRDFNRASAQAALDFAEAQVFAPERNDFDFTMNRHILTALGIKYWVFKSNGPRLSDSQSWGEMISELTKAGILTPEDGRALASTKVLMQELPVINADWVKQPLPLTIAGVQLDTALDNVIPLPGALDDSSGLGAADAAGSANPAPSLIAAAKSRLQQRAKELLRLRDAFRKEEGDQAVERFKKRQIEDGEFIFKMSAKEMADTFGITRKP